MPFPVTPSPFRPSRRQPATTRRGARGAGPQFSNSPRFLLSQSTPKKNDDFEIDDEDEDSDDPPPSTARAARTPGPSHRILPTPRRQREVIQDSDDGEEAIDEDIDGSGQPSNLIDDAIHSTPPGEPGPLDAEFEAIFAPERDGKKRRRLGGDTQEALDQNIQQLLPLPRPASPTSQLERPIVSLESPAPHPTPGAIYQEPNILQGTPAPRTKFMGSGVVTPGPTKTPFRSKPRFVLSTKKAPATQPGFRVDTPLASEPASPPERRKPAFILPRSLSPSAAADDIPAPFSPSSRALRRRGRPRTGAESYVPGGMAAEVRSWILEMGSKRETTLTSTLQSNQANGGKRYLLTARVIKANQTFLSNSGPLAFIEAEVVEGSASKTDDSANTYILAMGLPRSKPASRDTDRRGNVPQSVSLQKGDLVGIHHGLAWNMELSELQSLGSSLNPVEILQKLSSTSDICNIPKRDWLVSMEWDILET